MLSQVSACPIIVTPPSQDKQIDRFRRLESMALPDWLDYAAVTGLRAEARECLTRVEPRTLGQAGRLAGISPADITVLWVYLKGRGRRHHRT